jgi:class 3 adenylate cyclase
MDTVSELGLRLRAAVHTGEIEILDGDVAGIGVHITSRVLDEATDDQIVVTRTVRELATGTDLRFERVGSTGLRGRTRRVGAVQSVDGLSDSSIGLGRSEL